MNIFTRLINHFRSSPRVERPSDYIRQHHPITLQEFLPELTAEEQSIQHVQQMVCVHFGITIGQLKSKSRKAQIMKAKHCLAYLLYFGLGFKSRKVGKIMERGHTVILDSLTVVLNAIDTESYIANDIKILNEKVLQHGTIQS